MLILTRRPGERVVIGGEILVTVMEVSGQTVRLGIAAPRGLPIYREEIWLAVQEQNRAASEASVEVIAAADGAQASRTQTLIDGPAHGMASPPSQAAANGPSDAAEEQSDAMTEPAIGPSPSV